MLLCEMLRAVTVGGSPEMPHIYYWVQRGAVLFRVGEAVTRSTVTFLQKSKEQKRDGEHSVSFIFWFADYISPQS